MNKSIINEYSIKGTIGHGSFSKVKLGINKLTEEKVAIKIIDKKKIKIDSERERVQRELNIIKKLNHINIVKIIQIKEDTIYIYIIMEYIENNLFFHIMNKKYLSEEESSFYFFQIISGIDYIHSQGIVHRDLKPENLLINKMGILKIIDFGLSNYYSKEGKLLSTSCGSPSYTAPEIILGKNYDGFFVDIWAIGIILFIMLCGYFPFDDRDNQNVLFKKIVKCKVDYPKFISQNAKDLLEKILVSNPEKRISLKLIKEHPFYLKGKNIFYKKFPEFDNKIEENNSNKEVHSQMKKIIPNFDLLKKILKRQNISQEKKYDIDNNINIKNNIMSPIHLLHKLNKEKQIYEKKYLFTDNKNSNQYNSNKNNLDISKYKNSENKEIKRESQKTLNTNSERNSDKRNSLRSESFKKNNSALHDYICNDNSFFNRKNKNNVCVKVCNIYKNKTFTKRKNLSLKKNKNKMVDSYHFLKCLTLGKGQRKIKVITKSANKRKKMNNNLVIINYKNISSKNIFEKVNKSLKINKNKKNKKKDKYNIKEIIKRRGLDQIINKS